ncbi:MAG: tetratricopeptide repeat protein [Tenacibaculum sp.]|nr:tetratricopeptide repeat protein [Tenacibaculum sp.]
MKKIILTLVLCNFLIVSNAQESFKKLIEAGIANHDSGKYEEAIKFYKKAQEIQPDSELVNYEISLSYYTMKNYKKAIEYSSKVIDKGENHLLPAYLTKGSALDMIGKTKKSIKLFKKGIKKLGDHYLLHFNLAINYLKIKEDSDGEKHLIEAIKNNPFHASSHYHLAQIHDNKMNRVPALLSSYYFMLIEPESMRADDIYSIIKKYLGKKVNKDSKNITINLSSNIKSEFSAADLMVAMLQVSDTLEENEGKSEEEMFVKKTDDFFSMLGELKESGKKSNIWWDFYIPFFKKLADSNHIETYCKFITQIDLKSKSWLEQNEDKITAFFEWLKKELK